QASLVQVRVATPRAVFLLEGSPQAGETWTITINDRPFSFRVATSSDASFTTIAQHLRDAINSAGAPYQACLKGDLKADGAPKCPEALDGQIVVQDSNPSPTSFYAGFKITHDLDGGATVL